MAKKLNDLDLGIVDEIGDDNIAVSCSELGNGELSYCHLASILVELYRNGPLPKAIKEAIILIVQDSLLTD